MGRRGPPPAPTRIKVLRGTHPYRLNREEPVARVGVPDPPEWLSPSAREVWEELVPEVEVMTIVSPADRYQLAVYCTAVAHYRELEMLISVLGPVPISYETGRPGRSVLLSAQRDLAHLVLKSAAEFGLSPRAGSEIRAGRRQGDDPREKLLST